MASSACKQIGALASRRFATHTPVEIVEKRRNLHADNTLKSNEKAARVLRDYLQENGESCEFESLPEEDLAMLLERFYLDLRRTDGEKYKVNSLTSIRYGLSRYLRAPPHNKPFDLIKDRCFQRANDSFKSAMVELKREGKGDAEHHPPMSEADLKKLYSSIHLTPDTPCGLANKVQFDVRLYFFIRGAENMHKMTQSTFEICSGDDGLRYVRKSLDELTKNHRELDREHITAIMPEIPHSPICPVSSFSKYLSKLNPKNDRLWQRPQDSFLVESPVWFCNIPIGVNTLQKFMPTLSKKCALPPVYTNHSVRSTRATLLSRNKFGAAQIMSVTGHKSVSSLSVYQRVGDEEKIQMGRALQREILGNEAALVPAGTTSSSSDEGHIQETEIRRPLRSISNNISASTNINSAEVHLRGVNMNDLFCEFDQLPHRPAPMPLFHGCNITNLNIHYH